MSGPFMLVPQQQQQPMQQQFQAPIPQNIVFAPQPQIPVAQPTQGPYGEFLNAFSGAFQPVNDVVMAKRPAPAAREQTPLQPAGSHFAHLEAEARKSPSAAARMPVYDVLDAYEKLGNLTGKIPDGVYSQLAANIWSQGMQIPVDINIFTPPSSSNKRQRDDNGKFAPQSQQQQQAQSSQQEAPMQQQQYPQQPQPYPQQPQQPQPYPQQPQQYPQQQTPGRSPVIHFGPIPPGMQVVPLGSAPQQQPLQYPPQQQQQPLPYPAQQQQQFQYPAQPQYPMQQPPPTFDASKVKQRLGISDQSQPMQQPMQQQPHPALPQPAQQSMQQPMQQGPLQPLAQQAPPPRQIPAPLN